MKIEGEDAEDISGVLTKLRVSYNDISYCKDFEKISKIEFDVKDLINQLSFLLEIKGL